MGRGTFGLQQGVRAATAQQAEETALRNHPETHEQVAPDMMPEFEKRDWVRSVCPELTDAEVQEAVDAMLHYSGSGSRAIHQNNPDNDPKVAAEIKAIDRVLTSKNTPVYKGEIFRGVLWKQGEKALRDIIERGTWMEKGITSFSTKRSVAKSFSSPGLAKSMIQVILHVPEGKNISGVPFQHMSKYGKSESEVLMPSSIANRGWGIKSAKWSHGPDGRRIVDIEIEENIRRLKK